MRQILCYGDSNTWGTDPADDTRRHDWSARWPGVLQRELGSDVHVVEDGLGGRTTVYDDPLLPHRNGKDLIGVALELHAPLDLVVLMLGTNDISYAHLTAADAAAGVAELTHLVLRSAAGPAGPDGPAPHVLLVCPPPVGPFHDNRRRELWAGADVKSRALPHAFARVASELGVPWLDAGELIETSPLDGWHLEASQHELLGVAVAARVRDLLGG
ncbi:MAG: SGNH/GDSL hydrolase family protein [Actinobacteria bacterium]|nr:SGNH/GDSL hydrolase family protein [Actinomycetota bacterium]